MCAPPAVIRRWRRTREVEDQPTQTLGSLMRARLVIVAAAVQVAIGVISCERRPPPAGRTSESSPSSASAQTAPQGSDETIESAGLILGVGIGMPLADARARLDPLRVAGEHVPDFKEQAGKRVHWKLAGTEYDTIIVWANGAGAVTRVRANPRAERLKPFSEIGDLSRATAHTPQQAVWTVTRPERLSYRVVAQGDKHHANTLYMFALELNMR